MILPDVNVLVYAHREDTDDHPRYRAWLTELVDSPRAYGLCDHVLSGFLRVVTHPRVFREPSSLDDALGFVREIRERPGRVRIVPGDRHWGIFRELVRSVDARGNLIPDAYFAALAIESGSEWITTDRDCARFPGLSWSHPLVD